MTNFNQIFDEATNRRGLYRVWTPLFDNGQAPLVSIWIDSSMAAFEPEPPRETLVLGDGCEEIVSEASDDPPRRTAAGSSEENALVQAAS